jgi:hypothetical protein
MRLGIVTCPLLVSVVAMHVLLECYQPTMR